MRYVALFLGLVIGTSCFAARPAKVAGAPNYARKIAGASSWDSLFKSVDGTLNPLVMKELRALTNGLPYPQMRMKNDRLMISNENGEHLTMVLFEKNGEVSFNGKRWEIQPLASTESEVKRIAAILGGAHASLWDYVVSPAYAGGLSMTMGVAAAAYTSAASWKAEACAKPNPPDELVKTCSLMAVSMEGTPLKGVTESFEPVDVICPKSNHGTFVMITKNSKGNSERITATFEKNISTLKYEVSPGREFSEIFNYNFLKPEDATFKPMAENIAKKVASLNQDYCLANNESNQARFASLLQENKKKYRVSSIEADEQRGSRATSRPGI